MFLRQHKRKGPMLKAHKEEIITMNKEGKTAKQIAGHFGVTRSFVSKKLREWGIRKEKIKVNTGEIIVLYKKTNSIPDVSNKTGISKGIIYKILISEGVIEVKKINRKVGPFQKRSEEIIKKYQAGESSDKIAKDIGCSSYTVLKILRNAGVVRSKQTNVLKDHKEEIFRLYNEEELTQSEIAKRFGVSTSSISLFLRVNKTNG